MGFIKSKAFWFGMVAAVIVISVIFRFAPESIDAKARQILGA